MAEKRKSLRPLNHSYKSDWYWDYDKRLTDALIAQNGVEEEGKHRDGLHERISSGDKRGL